MINKIRKSIVLITLIGFGIQSFAQKNNFNFIITVDGRVNPTISSLSLKVFSKNEDQKEYFLDYYPGSIIINEDDYKEIKMGGDIKAIHLILQYIEVCGESTQYYNYEIDDCELTWLENDYSILHVINTDKKKYRKIYDPLPDKNFTYEYEYPGGATKRVQKKFTKEQRRCSQK